MASLLYCYYHDGHKYVVQEGDDAVVRCVRLPSQVAVLAHHIEQQHPVQACSLCATVAPNHPQSVLDYMRSCTLPPALGGYDKVDAETLVSLQLGMAYQHGDQERMLYLLRRHPLRTWLATVGMEPTVDLARLLALIYDPLRFVDLRKPNRVGRLISWFCLCRPPRNNEELRRNTAVTVPLNGYFRDYALKYAAMNAEPNEDLLSSFLWDGSMLARKTAKHLLVYIYRAWLFHMYPDDYDFVPGKLIHVDRWLEAVVREKRRWLKSLST